MPWKRVLPSPWLQAFEDLATAILTQFGPMLGGERGVWNCDMAALHYVLTHPRCHSRWWQGEGSACQGLAGRAVQRGRRRQWPTLLPLRCLHAS